ncbi:MAG: hypothetical protein WCA46_02520 [Actinocatenispora sp.]
MADRIWRTALPWRYGGEVGLVLDVARPRRPGLRVEVAGQGRFLLSQGGEPVLFAQVDSDRYGVTVRRTGRYRSPLPPARADEGRRIAGPARWAHRYADHLDGPDGPLHAGRWFLRAVSLPGYTWHEDLVDGWSREYLDWLGNGWNGVVPLRRLSDVDSSRVRAFRQRVVTGTLAPVLLWWISGLDGYVLLDGHDRAVAALAEGVTPPVLVLALGMSTQDQAALSTTITDRHQQIVDALPPRGTPAADRQHEAVSRSYAYAAAELPTWTTRTRAWPLPGGVSAWDALAAASD